MLLSDADISHYISICSIVITGDYDIQSCGIDLPVHLNHSTILINPGDFILLKTKGVVSLCSEIAGMLGGRSSYARRGLLIHCTSSLISPGFCGNIVLEIKNLGNKPITIKDGEKICSLSFLKMHTPCNVPYNGKYQGQSEAKP